MGPACPIATDMTLRDHMQGAYADMYGSGPPCQAFSLAGLNGGLQDPRGLVILHVVITILSVLPRAFYIENVPNIARKAHAKLLQGIISMLSVRYEVAYDILNSCNYGVPQNRERLYLIGVRKDSVFEEFRWPKPDAHHPDPNDFLLPRTNQEKHVR